jgi:phage FluMu protein Com
MEKIEIATYPDSSLKFIGELPKVKSLKIIHLPKVSDISPLSQLESLETLELTILPSWNKIQHISTLRPLQDLAKLRTLTLLGIFVDDGSLQPLHSCPLLCEFHSGNLFSMQELLSLKYAKPEIKGTFFEPIVELPYTRCSKCGSLKVILSGVIKYAIQCPKCHHKRVQSHLAEWKACQTTIAA